MEKSIKILLILAVSCLFIFIALASGERETKKWEANKKELFCGLEFENTTTFEDIAMEIKRVTILNCDGTYESRQSWSSDDAHKQDYRNTVGRSSDEDYSFKGTWQIIEPTSSLKGDGSLDRFKPTYIKFVCSNGSSAYAEITCMENSLSIQLFDETGVPIVDEEEITVGMFSGMIRTRLENIKY